MADNTLYERLELSLPGSWVVHDDRDYAWAVNHLLRSAVDQFNCALVACQCFEPVFASDWQRSQGDEILPLHDPVSGHLSGIFARAYVFALDATGRFVQAVQNQPKNTGSTNSTCASLIERFKDIRDIRDSLAHVDERAQGRARKEKLRVPVIVLGCFLVSQCIRFGGTSKDGRQVYIEISEGFLKGYRSMLEDVIWSFEWIVIGDTRATRPEPAERG